MQAQQSAISNQQSAISNQQSAISNQQSAISNQQSAISNQQSAISNHAQNMHCKQLKDDEAISFQPEDARFQANSAVSHAAKIRTDKADACALLISKEYRI